MPTSGWRNLRTSQRCANASHDEVGAGSHKRFPDNPFTPRPASASDAGVLSACVGNPIP
jgi:hypothetical protein